MANGKKYFARIKSSLPPIDLNLIFEKSSWVNLIFCLFQTLQATQAVKIKFEIDKKSCSSNWIFQTGFFKNQVQINRDLESLIKVFLKVLSTEELNFNRL